MRTDFSKTFLFFGELVLNLFIVIVVLLILYNLYKFIKKEKDTKFKIHYFDRLSVLIVSGFSFLGFTIGLLVGMSLSPVVQVVIPALLTFYGGFLIYVISKRIHA